MDIPIKDGLDEITTLKVLFEKMELELKNAPTGWMDPNMAQALGIYYAVVDLVLDLQVESTESLLGQFRNLRKQASDWLDAGEREPDTVFPLLQAERLVDKTFSLLGVKEE